jgi:Putative peptidoglycan binding domain
MPADDELEAIALEDDDPLAHVGDEADAPGETGREPAPEDAEPPADEVMGGPEEPAPRSKAWRMAGALEDLRGEINARWPNRDKKSDGGIGDKHHCPPGGRENWKKSQHCPNPSGVVCARDFDSDGIPAAWLAEHVRKLGLGGDKRLANTGYVIYNRRIASAQYAWVWRVYRGLDPHTSHVHVTVSTSPTGYDVRGSWGVRTTTVPTGPGVPGDLPKHPLGSRELRLVEPKMRGTDVAFVQRWVGADADNGVYDQHTVGRVERFQGIVGLEPSGVVGEATWKAMRVT